MKRLLFIDNLKTNLIVLVILHHVAVAYGGNGGWPIIEEATDSISPIVFTLFNTINQSFFMSLFFLLSGFFIVGSLARKGTFKYIKDRLMRLGIPLLGYVYIISPIIDYLVVNYSYGQTLSFIDAFTFRWTVGPLWFVEALLIFSFLYLIARSIFKFRTDISLFKDKFPANFAIVLSIATIALLTFGVRVIYPVGTTLHVFQPGHFVHYTFAFIIGIAAYNNNWFNHLEKAKIWKVVASLVMLALPITMSAVMIFFDGDISPFLGGFTWQSLLFTTWESIAFISIIISLLYIFKKRFNNQGLLAKWASPNFYGAYIFHAPIIMIIMIPLLDFAIPSILKAFIVAVISVSVSFLFTDLLRKIPLVRKVLG